MGHEDVWPEAVELLAADAFHLAKVFNLCERPLRGAVVDDPLRQLRSYAGQAFQIGGGGTIQIDPTRRVRIGGMRTAGRCRRRGLAYRRSCVMA